MIIRKAIATAFLAGTVLTAFSGSAHARAPTEIEFIDAKSHSYNQLDVMRSCRSTKITTVDAGEGAAVSIAFVYETICG